MVEFISKNKTIYLSTHTPLGYENLENHYIIDLANPLESIPVGDIVIKTATGKYICTICGYVYDPAVGDPTQNIPPGTAFEDLPDNWRCPRCKNDKTKFNRA